jgi:DNA-binding MarR family transcriptional regulator
VRRSGIAGVAFFTVVTSPRTMQEFDHPEGALADLPPSSKLVFKTLEWNGRLTQQGIIEESLLSGRTVRDAVARLEDRGIVEREIHYRDARQNVYTLATSEA